MPVVNPGVVCIPARGPSSTSQDLYETTADDIDSGTAVVLDVSTPFAKVGLVRIKVKHISGATAATFQPYIFSKVGVSTAGDIAQEYAGASTAVATLFDPGLAQPVWMQCDENGRLYLFPTPDAGLDNVFSYSLRFLKGE